MALSKLSKKDFEKNYNSDNRYTRTLVQKEQSSIERLRVVYDVVELMITEHKVQINEVNALIKAYTINHIVDISDGNKVLYINLLNHLHILDTTTKITKTKVLKEWFFGDYIKIIGVIIDDLSKIDKLNTNQIITLLCSLVEIWFDDGEDI